RTDRDAGPGADRLLAVLHAGGRQLPLPVWDAVTTPGAGAVADLLRLDEALAGADLVLTGEGRFDATSLRGKAVGEVLRRAHRADRPAVVIAGDAAPTSSTAAESADPADPAVPAVHTLTRLAGSAEAARSRPLHWLRRAGALLAARY
ncbi:glycerate kinase, partial [Kitasatospora sp. NPDC089797]|uniref:glycerate kinase n=1 Tax=Kitasatospora sp. NPDC089797 TaxID=3155298 RepID=UPI00342E5C95